MNTPRYRYADYLRAGVEHVMGFCTKEQHNTFLQMTPFLRKNIIMDNGIIFLTHWLGVGDKQQERRFRGRIEDLARQWKLSNRDLPSRQRWYDYSRARDQMLDATDTDFAPWNIVDSNDKKRARLNVISHLLGHIPYEKQPREKVKLPERDMTHKYDDEATMTRHRWIAQRF